MKLYRFKQFLFEGDLAFFFKDYEGHTFYIDHEMADDPTGSHVWVYCVDDPTVAIRGYIHLSDLEPVDGSVL